MTNNKNSKFIKISNVKASGNKLEVKLEFSKEVAKYFFKNHFEVLYDKNIENVDESILSIPAVCVTIQVAWATGADLYVDKLDERCLSILPKIRKVFQEFYPKFSSSGDIHVKEPVMNKFNNKQTALFYTGGLDSTVSYIRNIDQNPILISLLKFENSAHKDGYQNRLRILHQTFADREGREINFIRSNVGEATSDTINDRLLAEDFTGYHWWGGVSHGLILLGLCAPLTVERIGKVLLASSTFENERTPHGSNFLLLTDFSWADICVFYDGADLTRQEKILHVLKTNQQYQKYLRVCLFPLEGPHLKNCGHCEKCLRTITGLIMEGIEPNECNFQVKNNVFDKIKNLLTTCKFLFDRETWFDIQKHIPDRRNDDEVSRKYHAKEFFEWFRDYDFSNYKEENEKNIKLKMFYYYHLKHKGINNFSKEVLRSIRRRLIEKKK